MKRISFLIIVFMFTTAGFFKSNLEECADTHNYVVVGLGEEFIKKSLKNKMKDSAYENIYLNCVTFKKTYPEVFEAKYD